MRKALFAVLLLALTQPAHAGPLDWAKHHKRFLLMESAALAGAGIHAAGLHHCRQRGVENCDERYGSAWAMFGLTTGFTTIVLPATAEGCWKENDDAKFCYLFAYSGSAFQTSWGLHEFSIKRREHEKTILFTLLCASSTLAVTVCNDGLWKHVYNPERLRVHQLCVSVTGTIVDATHGRRKDGVRKEADGDCHGWLKLDVGQEQFLNDGNKSDEDGNLVFEIVCMFPVTQKDAIQACKNYKSKVVLPPVGSHVKISGSWVMDDNHARWMEIHPVTSIEAIP